MLISVEEYIVLQTENAARFDISIFNWTCFVFYLIYAGILAVIFLYITQLASNKKQIKKIARFMSVCAGVVFVVIAAYLCFNGYMYRVSAEGRIYLSNKFYLYLVFGTIDALATLIVSICNKRNIARKFFFFICLFVPVDILLLGLQYHQKEIFFTSLTYVLPFVLFYLLFHSNPYDENSGCQNAYSFETRLGENVRYHRKYMIVYVVFPALQKETLPYSEEEIHLAVSASCRKAEKLCFGIHLYAMNHSSYAFFVNMKDRDKAKEVFEGLHDILDHPIMVHNQPVRARYKMVGFFDNAYVKNIKQVKSFVSFLMDKIDVDSKNRNYFCEKEDYEAFYRQYQIYQMLMDIRDANDLNDERVLCYTQPIYDIRSNSFRTAEALMRLSWNGRIIYPDQFIELAEENDCIHALTKIILNKVCQNVKRLQKDYDFDAITVNEKFC